MLPNPFLKNRSGIYGIRSLDTGKIYVGRTRCMFQRCKQYVNAFRSDSEKHLNDHIRNSVNAYGIERFEMFPLEFCEQDVIKDRENYWMDKLQSCERETGFNLRRDTDGGFVTSASTSAKISARLRKEWASGARDGHAARMRDKWSGDTARIKAQGKMFSRIKTKWVYNINFPDGTNEQCVFFARLKELGIDGVQQSFWRKKTDIAKTKGHTVERVAFNRGKVSCE